MIEETITQLEQRLRHAGSMPEQNRQELLGLLATLKKEAAELSKTHSEQAQKIVGLAQVSTHEATSEQKNPDRLQRQVQDLTASVEGFEESHPKLVVIVNRIAETLANLGI